MFYSIVRKLIYLCVKICFRVEVAGRENLPNGKFVLACNHISNWDPPLIGAMIPAKFCFVAKEELFQNKLFGFILKRLNAMPVNRKNADIGVVKASLEGLKNGKSLIIFPEGTRHGFAKGIKVKTGFVNLAHKAKVPLVPVRIDGEYKFRSKIKMTIGEPIDLGAYQERKLTDEQAEEIKNKVVALIGAEEPICRLS